jgi:hypothetical protein
MENLLNSELDSMNVKKSQMMRTDPVEQHPVWVKHFNIIYPAMLRCVNGFKLNKNDSDLLEVREGDVVSIEVNQTQATLSKKSSKIAVEGLPFRFCGEIRKPEKPGETELDCDFVVFDTDENLRYLV